MTTEAQEVSLETIIDRYVKLRDKKSQMEAAHKEALAPINQAMDRLENAILDRLNQQGVESVRTTAGTAYKSTSVSVTVADKQVFRQWLIENGQWEMADIRAAKTNVAEYRASNDDIPPGLNYRESLSVGIRRA